MARIIRKTSKKICTHKCNSSLFSKSLSQSNKNKLTSSFESWLELTSQHNVTIRKQNKTNVFDDIRGNAYELKTFRKNTFFYYFMDVCVPLNCFTKMINLKNRLLYDWYERGSERKCGVSGKFWMYEYSSDKSYGVSRLYKWLITSSIMYTVQPVCGSCARIKWSALLN